MLHHRQQQALRRTAIIFQSRSQAICGLSGSLDMSNSQAYNSPTQSTSHPYFQQQNGGADQPEPQEVPDDEQLRADLSRNLGHVMSGFGNLSGSNPLPYAPHTHAQELPGGLVQFEDGSQHGVTFPQGSPDPQAESERNKRTKVSRACDECRRKKVGHINFPKDSLEWACVPTTRMQAPLDRTR